MDVPIGVKGFIFHNFKKCALKRSPFPQFLKTAQQVKLVNKEGSYQRKRTGNLF